MLSPKRKLLEDKLRKVMKVLPDLTADLPEQSVIKVLSDVCRGLGVHHTAVPTQVALLVEGQPTAVVDYHLTLLVDKRFFLDPTLPRLDWRFPPILHLTSDRWNMRVVETRAGKVGYCRTAGRPIDAHWQIDTTPYVEKIMETLRESAREDTREATTA